MVISMERFFKHLHTVNVHRWEVFKLCLKCGIPFRGLLHDLSKYSFTEFFESMKFYSSGKYSPIVDCKKKKGYSNAWLHHKGRNKHHWEYWYDTYPDRGWVPIKMPDNYLAESICDRIAACKTYRKEAYKDSDALDYFLAKPDKEFMHPETAASMEHILRMVAEEGEAAAFAYIRNCLKNNTPL